MKKTLFTIIVISIFAACTNAPKQTTEQTLEPILERVPEAVIYEVNIRQYTPEGTINTFREHLSRLDDLGVDILWLMPIYPISELNRKATQLTLVEEIEDPEEQKNTWGATMQPATIML